MNYDQHYANSDFFAKGYSNNIPCRPLQPALDLIAASGDIHSVITCNKCGAKNSDETRFCEKCGNKLQSSRRIVPNGEPSAPPLEAFRHQGVSDDARRTLMRMIEAWGYVGLLAAVAVGCAVYERWWPLYPAVALLGLIIWIRRV